MNLLQVNFENKETILNEFERIADKFSKNIYIKINNSTYRIVDFEFYAYSESFPDPQTHKNNIQLENSKFYLHSSGIDITFGDGKSYGGILIRGVVKMFDGADQKSGFSKTQFDGPQNVATELFSNLNNLTNSEPNEIALIDIEGNKKEADFYPAIHLLKTKRVGLTPKADDKEDYYMNLPLRYIAVLRPSEKFKQKIKGKKSLLKEGVANQRLSEIQALEIIGYKIVF